MEVPWVILNKSYILAFIKQQPYVVDLLALQKQVLQEHLSQLALPWASRPLLVPIRYLVTQKFKTRVPELSQNLIQLGMHLELLGENEVLIRTIPLNIPYLDLTFRTNVEDFCN
ncbi:MAG: hypothetical protein WBV77_11445 [Solirubrobacteraceae bacterium]